MEEGQRDSRWVAFGAGKHANVDVEPGVYQGVHEAVPRPDGDKWDLAQSHEVFGHK